MRDSKQQFIVESVSRTAIAEEINDFLAMTGASETLPVLQEDDDRLTDEICQEFACGLHQADVEADGNPSSRDDLVDDLITRLLQKMGVEI